MTSTLPTRWQEILRREAAANVGTVLAQAKEQPGARRLPRWTMPALVVGVASVSLLTILGGSEVKGKGTVPFDRSSVISARSAGLGASAEDLAPRATASAASVAPLDDLPAARERRRAAMMALDASPSPQPTPTPSPSPTPAPLVINIGTRDEAVLTEPVVTGAALAPAPAKLANDVLVGDNVAIPAGTLLVGEGFATQQDDRPGRVLRRRQGRQDDSARRLGQCSKERSV